MYKYSIIYNKYFISHLFNRIDQDQFNTTTTIANNKTVNKLNT